MIPLIVFFFKKPPEKYLAIVAVYLLVALFLNASADISWKYFRHTDSFFTNNGIFYNIHSFCRIILFILFFAKITGFSVKKAIFFFIVYIGFFTLYFILINKEFNILINSLLYTTEGLILLILSLGYLIHLIRSEEVYLYFDPYLLIIAGLAIYESVNFFVFLFYDYVGQYDTIFAHYIWNVHNVIFIVFCLLIARAFLGRFKIKRSIR
jgi:hypothetical protein